MNGLQRTRLVDQARQVVAAASLALLTLGLPTCGQAQTVWPMTTEYPKGNISGVGLATFAQLIAVYTGGLITVEPAYDSKITSGQLVQAATEGRVAGGDAFAGPMDALDPVFALPSLPFIVRSVAEARALNTRARPAYEAALARHGMRLLYLTIWPPTGLWSDRVLVSPDDLHGLRVRTYDDNSAAVLTAAGTHAAYMPFGEAMARLQRRELDGVLTSGDGGVARGLWDALPHFTAISYAIPVSFAFVRADAFDALPEPVREQVLTAARETEARQFALLETRVQENYAQMRARGVSIADPPPAGLVAHLRQSAGPTLRDWRARVPAELRELSQESASR